MNLRKTARVILVSQDNKLVLMKRIKTNSVYYTLIGGGLEQGETPEQAVIREVYEEVGSVISTPEFVFKTEYYIDNAPTECKRVENFFVAKELKRGTATGPEWNIRNTPDNMYQLVEFSKDELADINIVPEELKNQFIEIFLNYIENR